jgi:hypothetical protein
MAPLSSTAHYNYLEMLTVKQHGRQQQVLFPSSQQEDLSKDFNTATLGKLSQESLR